ncbi:MAG: zinc metalloprotease HtpX [Deltaproteobacteria bacterium]|nr:zinc metalloprotease HtpX [Deltaproteobacteria bacterium]
MRNQLKTLALLGAMTALVVGIGGLIAPSYLYLFGLLALAMNAGAYYFSDRLVLRMHHAEEIRNAELSWLHTEVETLAQRAGIPKPRLFLIREDQPNAFATGRNPEHGVVAVTQGLLDNLDRREIRGVLAHEIAHIKNRDILIASVAAAMSSLLTYAAHALTFSSFFGQGDDGDESPSAGTGLLVAIVAPVAAMLVQMGISRSREFLADETAAELTQDPRALASALMRLQGGTRTTEMEASPATASLFIVNPFSGAEHVSRLFSTHPSTEARVQRLLARETTSGDASWSKLRQARAGKPLFPRDTARST